MSIFSFTSRSKKFGNHCFTGLLKCMSGSQFPRFSVQYLPPYSPFLNPIEEIFSAWRWKVYCMNGSLRAGSHCSRPRRRLVAMLRPVRASCVYETSRATLSHFTKREVAHSPESFSFIHLYGVFHTILLFCVLYMLGSVQQMLSCVFSMNGMCV